MAPINLALGPNDTNSILPIGQLLWFLINCGENIKNLTKIWVSGVFSISFRSNPAIITYCPDHPQILCFTPLPGESLSCNFKDCHNIYCIEPCHSWHPFNPSSPCTFVWSGKKCPKCHVPTVKSEGCNHIACRCGCHWCYFCEFGPCNSKGEVYAHMRDKHGSYYT